MTKHSAVYCLCLLVAIFPLCGRTEAPAEAGTLYQKLTRHNFIHGRFRQTRELSGIPAPVKSKGRFMIWRSNGLYWETASPLFHATTFTDEQVYQWTEPGVAEPMSDGALQINQRISSVILALFEADFDGLRNNFEISVDDDGEQWNVVMTPVNKYIRKALERISVTGDTHIRTVLLTSTTGDTTRIEMEVTSSGDEPDKKQLNRLSPAAIRQCCLDR